MYKQVVGDQSYSVHVVAKFALCVLLFLFCSSVQAQNTEHELQSGTGNLPETQVPAALARSTQSQLPVWEPVIPVAPEWQVPDSIITDENLLLHWRLPQDRQADYYEVALTTDDGTRRFQVAGNLHQIQLSRPGKYNFQVRACWRIAGASDLCSEGSSSFKVTHKRPENKKDNPAKSNVQVPSNLSAVWVDQSANIYDLRFSYPGGATGIRRFQVRVFYTADLSTTYTVTPDNNSQTEFFKRLQNQPSIKFQVRALHRQLGWSAWSAEFPWVVQVTLPAGAPTDAPQGTWINEANSQFVIDGNYPSANIDEAAVTYYRLQETNPSGAVTVTTTFDDRWTLTKTGGPYGDYYYQYAACTQFGCSAYSPVLTWPVNDPNLPTIVYPGNQVNTEGSQIALAIQASSASGSPITYAADFLPTGLSIDAQSGVISGQIAAIGTQSFASVVTATTAAGSTYVVFSWHVTSATQVGQITFVDASLQQCVLDSVSGNGDVAITAVTNLDCRDRGISNLSGIEFLRALRIVDFGSYGTSNPNQVSDLADLAELADLHTIQVHGNNISDLPDLSGTDIDLLNLSDNPISSLSSLANNSTIRVIHARNSAVNTLAGLDTAPVQKLYMAATPLSSIAPLANHPNLTLLEINSTQVNNIDAISSIALTALYANNTPITDLSPLSGHTTLDTLWLEDTAADLSPLNDTQISVLVLTRALNVDLSQFAGLTSLSNLRINDVGTLSGLETIAGFPQLTVLNVGNNNLTDLSFLYGATSLISFHSWNNDHSALGALDPLLDLHSLNTVGLVNSNLADIQALITLGLSPDSALNDTYLLGNNGLPCQQLNALEGLVNIVTSPTSCVTGGDVNPPIITAMFNQSSYEGQTISPLQIEAIDPEGTSLTYVASGLPSGLAIDRNTGVISGTLDVGWRGTNNVTVSVSDGTGISHVDFLWEVSAYQYRHLLAEVPLDSSLEACVTDHVNILLDAGLETEVAEASLTNLCCFNRGVTSLQGLDRFPGLLRYYFGNNPNVPQAATYCHSDILPGDTPNQITDASVLDTEISLTSIDVSGSPLDIVAEPFLNDEGGFDVLLMESTSVSDISWIQRRLKILDISDTAVSEFPLDFEMGSLFYLDISNTNISSLAGIDLNKLSTLNISNTNISDVSHVNPSNIHSLYIDGSDITDFSFLGHLPELYRVRVSGLRDLDMFEISVSQPHLNSLHIIDSYFDASDSLAWLAGRNRMEFIKFENTVAKDIQQLVEMVENDSYVGNLTIDLASAIDVPCDQLAALAVAMGTQGTLISPIECAGLPGLQSVTGVGITQPDPSGLYSIFWSYPENAFASPMGRPTRFRIDGAFTDPATSVPLAELTVLAGAPHQTQWAADLGDDLSGHGNAVLIRACQNDGGPEVCSAAVMAHLPSSQDISLPIPNWEGSGVPITANSDHRFELSWTSTPDDRIDYFEIRENDPAANELVYFSEEYRMDFRRLWPGNYTFTIRSCQRRRNHPQGDVCSTGSAPQIVTIDRIFSLATVSDIGWLDEGHNQIRIRIGDYQGLVNSSIFAPDYFQLETTGAGHPGIVREVRLQEFHSSSYWDSDVINTAHSEWRIRACKRYGEAGTPRVCGSPVAVILDADNLIAAPATTQAADVVGGPDELRPGEWFDPDRPGTGWSFYWANELRYDSQHELYGNTYDLLGYWLTYRKIKGQWQSTWLFSQMKLVNEETPAGTMPVYKGTLYYPRHLEGQSTELREVGEVIIQFDPNSNNELTTVIATVNELSGMNGRYTQQLSYLGGENGPLDPVGCDDENPVDHYRGMWWHNSGTTVDDRFVSLNWIDGKFESMIVPFYDDDGNPVWARGDWGRNPDGSPRNCDSPLTTASQVDFEFFTVTRGFDPRDPSADAATSFLADGIISADRYLKIGEGGRSFDTDEFRSGYVWLDINLDLAYVDPATSLICSLPGCRHGILEVGSTGTANYSVEKVASLHDIRFFINGQHESISECRVNGDVQCGVTLTWFTDDVFDPAQVFRCSSVNGVSTGSCTAQPVGTGYPSVLDHPDNVTGPGAFIYELRKQGGTVIARSREITLNVVEQPMVGSNPVYSVPLDTAGALHDRPIHDATIGSDGGQGGVSGGAATYTIPIAVPPGRRGIQPSLAFSYSSRAGNGHLGMGWSMSGLSSIHRCPQTLAQDNKAGTVRYDSGDRLCLDGQRLMVVNGDYGAANSEYRTELDSFYKITQLGGNLSSTNAYFRVQTPSGMDKMYGNGINAKHTPQNAPAPLSWAVSHEQDPSGNSMSYHYRAFGDGEFGIDKITYTGSGASEGNREIQFSYSTRNDVASSYQAGAMNLQRHRLEKVTTFAPNQAGAVVSVRELNLSYRYSDSTGRSLLDQVELCAYNENGANPKCKPPTTISWHEDAPSFISEPGLSVLNALVDSVNVTGMSAQCDDPGSCVQLICTTSDIRDCQISPVETIVSLGNLRGDYDGDGVREIIGGYRSEFLEEGDTQVVTGQALLSLNADGSIKGTIDMGGFDGFQRFFGSRFREIDFDDDGRVDLIGSRDVGGERYMTVARWDGTEGWDASSCVDGSNNCPFTVEITNVPFDPEVDLANSDPYYDELALADFNRDGEIDVLVAKTVGAGLDAERALYLWLHKSDQVSCAGSQTTDQFCAVAASGPNGLHATTAEAIYQAPYYDSVPGIIQPPGAPARLFPERLGGVVDLNGDGVLEIQMVLEFNTSLGSASFSKYIELISGNGSPFTVNIYDESDGNPFGLEFVPLHVFHQQLDVNGDGLLDYLYLPIPASNPSEFGGDREWHLQLNTGAALGPDLYSDAIPTGSRMGLLENGWNPYANGQTPAIDPALRIQNWRPKYAGLFQVVDLDNDGRQELLFPAQTEHRSCTFIKRNIGDCSADGDGGAFDCEPVQYCPTIINGLNASDELQTTSEEWDLYHVSGATQWDSTIYRYDSLRPVQTGQDSWTVQRLQANLQGDSSTQFGDLFGDGKTDAWSHFGCRIANCFYVADGSDTDPTHDIPLVGAAASHIPSGFHWSKAELDGVRPNDFVGRITDGLGRESFWEYLPLTSNEDTPVGQLYSVPMLSSQRYITDQPGHFYFTSSMYVVSQFAQSNAAVVPNSAEDHLNRTFYGYSEAIYNSRGRGFQGFRKIVSEQNVPGDENNNLRSTSLFHQFFPFAGRLDTTMMHLASDPLSASEIDAVETTHYTWVDEAGPVPGVRFVYSNEQRSETRQLDNRLRLISSNLVDGIDYDAFGNLLTQTSTQSDYDENGTLLQTAVVSQNNHYATADTANWWINRLGSSQTTTSRDYHGAMALPGALPNGFSLPTMQQLTTWTDWDVQHRLPRCTYQFAGALGIHNGTGDCSFDTSALVDIAFVGTEHQYDQYGNSDVISVDASDPAQPDRRIDTRSTYSFYSDDGYYIDLVRNALSQNVSTKTDPRYGNPTEIRDANQLRTGFVYDEFGMEVERYYPTSDNINFDDVFNQYAPRSSTRLVNTGSTHCTAIAPLAEYCVLQITDGAPKVTAYVDQLGRMIETHSDGFKGAGGSAQTTVTHQVYNSRGQMVGETQPYYSGQASYETRYRFDPLGRRVLKTEPRHESVNDLEHLYTHYLHEGSRTTVWVTELSFVPPTVCAVDGPLTDKLCVRRTYGSGEQLLRTTDAHGSPTRFWADALGNPALIEDSQSNLTGANYNELGHRTHLFDPNMGDWVFSYNGLGEVVNQTDAEGQRIEFDYDKLGRLVERRACETSSCNPINETIITDEWIYDIAGIAGTGQLQSERRIINTFNGGNPLSERLYSYDAYGRPISQTTSIRRTSAVAETFQTTTEYDDYFARPIKTDYPAFDGQNRLSMYHKYDQSGYPIEQGEAALYDNDPFDYQAGALRQITAMNAAGQVTESQYINGRVDKMDYLPSTWQMASSSLYPDGSASSMPDGLDISYQYDRFGNLTNQTNGISQTVETFEYDRLHRLISSHRSYETSSGLLDDSVVYSYDALGNIKSKSDFGINYQYQVGANLGGPNAVTNVTLTGGGQANYSYDANGNMRTSTLGGLDIQYDAFNKPIQIQRNSSFLEFGYGSDQQRVWQIRDGRETLYIDKSYERIGGDGGEYKYYIGDWAVWTVNGNDSGLKFLHRDRLGSVMAISDIDGYLEDDATRGFDPFGKPRDDNWQDSTDGLNREDITTRGFTVHEHLNSVQLVHMNGRAYDYNLGRFLSVDPLISFPANSQSLNPYSYILNSPMAGTDPSGYAPNCSATPLPEEGGTVQCDIVSSKPNSRTNTRTTINFTRGENGEPSFSQVLGARDNGVDDTSQASEQSGDSEPTADEIYGPAGRRVISHYPRADPNKTKLKREMNETHRRVNRMLIEERQRDKELRKRIAENEARERASEELNQLVSDGVDTAINAVAITAAISICTGATGGTCLAAATGALLAADSQVKIVTGRSPITETGAAAIQGLGFANSEEQSRAYSQAVVQGLSLGLSVSSAMRQASKQVISKTDLAVQATSFLGQARGVDEVINPKNEDNVERE